MKDLKNLNGNWNSKQGINPRNYYKSLPNLTFQSLDKSYIKEAVAADFRTRVYTNRKITLPILEEMRDIMWIQSPEAAILIRPKFIIDVNGQDVYKLADYQNHLNNIFDQEYPITVLIDYPFDNLSLVTIYPIKQIALNQEYVQPYTIGYVCWQIVLAYAYLFKYEAKESGAWGHDLTDLRLTELIVGEENKVILSICS